MKKKKKSIKIEDGMNEDLVNVINVKFLKI